jgi:hypothetical protein
MGKEDYVNKNKKLKGVNNSMEICEINFTDS